MKNPELHTGEPKFDIEKIRDNAGTLLNQLARLTQALMGHWEDQSPEVKEQVGNACALIVRLQTYTGQAHDTSRDAPEPAPAVQVVRTPKPIPQGVKDDGRPAPPLLTQNQAARDRLAAKQAAKAAGPQRPQRPPNPFERVS